MTKLKNGAFVIDRTDNVVLARWDDHAHPFVTWKLDGDGNTYLGHYYKTLLEAVEDFERRQK